MKFTTKDRDNDRYSYANSALICKGAWWYKRLYGFSNLNGLYLKLGGKSTAGITWKSWRYDFWSMKKTEMKICTDLL